MAIRRPLRAATVGAAWPAITRRMLADSIVSRYDDLPVREISLVTLIVDEPDPGVRSSRATAGQDS